jgi:hypothetical protein
MDIVRFFRFFIDRIVRFVRFGIFYLRRRNVLFY